MLNVAPNRFAALTKGRLSLPLIGSPMFIVSGPELVIAQCKAGIIGCFPALNARPQSVLDDWLARITEELAAHDRAHPDRPAAPFAVNQIVHKSNKRIEDDLALCVKHKAPIVITSLGAREEVNATVHSYGGLVLHDVIDVGFARKAIEKGRARVAVRVGAGNPRLVARAAGAVGIDLDRARCSGGARHGRGLRLCRLDVHCDA
jgi:nitronate monooxygenase